MEIFWNTSTHLKQKIILKGKNIASCEKVCWEHGCCDIGMFHNDTNTLKYVHERKSARLPFAMYADAESLPTQKSEIWK